MRLFFINLKPPTLLFFDIFVVESLINIMSKDPINKGKIILALPTSNPLDAQFSKAVILIADMNTDGSLGFILNKPLEYTLDELLPDINGSYTVYDGGPVEQDKIFCVHSRADIIEDSQHIIGNLYWGGDYQQIFSFLEQGLINKNEIRFFVGYTGWDCQQLQNEVEDDFWIIANSTNPEIIFKNPSYSHWTTIIKTLGNRYNLWLNAPENPNLN